MSEAKPKGSGWFAAVSGLVFLIVFIYSLFGDLSKIPPYRLFQTWLVIATAILLIWGIRRIKTGKRDDMTIGQSTINFVVAIVSATFAILAIVLAAPPRP